MFREIVLRLSSLWAYFILCLFTLQSFASVWAQTAPTTLSPQAGSTSRPLGTEDSTPADLSKDARLNRRISLHEIGTPFKEVLKKISSPDLQLTVETDSAEQKLHIKIKQRSIRQLMQALADLLPGAWYARLDGSGYRYHMNFQAVRRRKLWWELFMGERENAFDAMRAAILQAMRTPPHPPARFVKDNTVEDGIDEEIWHKVATGKTFFNALPAALQEQVASQINDAPWYNLQGLETTSDMDEGAVVVPLRALSDDSPSRLNPAVAEMQRNMPLDQDAYVSFTNFGSSVTAALIKQDGAMLREIGTLQVPLGATTLLKLNHADLPNAVKKLGKEAPPAWKELAAYQQSRVWPNDLPTQYPGRDVPNRVDEQEWLAESEHIEFVSDYYTAFRGVTDVAPARMSHTLKAELDWQAQAQDLSWKKETGSEIFLFRNNRWYRDDLLEIPAAVLQPWLDYKKRDIEQQLQWQKQGIAPTVPMLLAAFRTELDGIADAVSALSPWQLFNCLQNMVVHSDQIPLSPIEQQLEQYTSTHNQRPRPRRAFRDDVSGILVQYRTLLFYGSLKQEERSALLEGRLDANSLTPAQQQQVRIILPLLQVIRPTRASEPFLIGMRPFGNGWCGMPHMHLFLASPSRASRP